MGLQPYHSLCFPDTSQDHSIAFLLYHSVACSESRQIFQRLLLVELFEAIADLRGFFIVSKVPDKEHKRKWAAKKVEEKTARKLREMLRLDFLFVFLVDARMCQCDLEFLFESLRISNLRLSTVSS